MTIAEPVLVTQKIYVTFNNVYVMSHEQCIYASKDVNNGIFARERRPRPQHVKKIIQ